MNNCISKLALQFSFIVCGLSLITMITACNTARENPTLSVPPSQTVQPPQKILPTPYQNATATFVPALTSTPEVSPLLPILEAQCFTDYPASIDLPTTDFEHYRLKTWNVEEAFRLIRTIDENSPPCNEYETGAEPVYSIQN